MTLKILQITDLHVFADHNARLKGIPTRETLIDTLADIRLRHADLDYMVVTGDHTHDELPETYADLADLLSEWKDRLFQVPGNHDERGLLLHTFPPANGLRRSPGDCVTFAFECGAWKLIGLDSHLPGEVSGHVESQQLSWLSQELEDQQPTGIFLHHPPKDVDSEWMDAIGIDNADELNAILTRHSHVRFICAGHVHHEFSCRLGSATMFTTPSTGLQFDPMGSRPNFSDLAPGYRIIHLSNDGTYKTHVERLAVARFKPDAEETN